jgi:hypothetical protein
MMPARESAVTQEGLAMRQWTQGGALVALGLAIIGCQAAPPPAPPALEAAEHQTLSAAMLPNVPGCDSVGRSNGQLTVRRVLGVHDLYLVERDGAPLCVDDAAGVDRFFVASLGEVAGSNPMPGYVGSNPMPGTDPGSSNPMPGHP